MKPKTLVLAICVGIGFVAVRAVTERPSPPPPVLSEADKAAACRVAKAYSGPIYARSTDPCDFKLESDSSAVVRVWEPGTRGKPLSKDYIFGGASYAGLYISGQYVHLDKSANGSWHVTPSREKGANGGLESWNAGP